MDDASIPVRAAKFMKLKGLAAVRRSSGGYHPGRDLDGRSSPLASKDLHMEHGTLAPLAVGAVGHASGKHRSNTADGFRKVPGRCALALAVGAVLGLTACGGGGGGGGGNVRPTPPPPTSPSPPPVTVAGQILSVKRGEAVGSVTLLGDAAVDNAGTIGGPGIELGVSGIHPGPVVYNHDGGRIEGSAWGVRLWGLGPRVQNTGAGSLITSSGIGIEYADDFGGAKIWNLDGATIRGGRIGIRLLAGGTITNGAGSTIEATGTTRGDCGAGGSCSIYVGPSTVVNHNTTLENAGTIIGNVQLDLDPRSRNEVTLVAGGRIVGDLSVGNALVTLVGDAGTTQRFSQAVTGTTNYAGGLTKNGAGTWILDTQLPLGRDLYDNYTSLQVNAGTLQIGAGGTEGPAALKGVIVSPDARLVFDRSDDFVFDGNFTGGGTLTQTGSGLLTLSFNGSGGASSIGRLEIDAGSRLLLTQNLNATTRNDGQMIFKLAPVTSSTFGNYWSSNITGSGSVIQNGEGLLTLGGVNTYTGGTVVNSGSLGQRRGLPGDLRINEGGEFVAGTVDFNNYVPRIGGTLYNAGRVVITQGDPIIWTTYAGVAGDVYVGGDYVQTSTGTFSITLGDKLDVTGAARLEGGTLEVRGAAVGYVASQRTDVLTAAGGVTGTFDRLVKGPGVVFTSNTIHYDANNVWLDTRGLDVRQAAAGEGIGYTAVSMSSAERVQGAFDQLDARIADGVPTGVSDAFLQSAGRFQRAPTIAAAQASLRSLSGQVHAASAAMTFRTIDAGGRALSDHFDELRDGRAGVGTWTKRVGGAGGMARDGYDGVGFQHDGWLVGTDHRWGHSGVVGVAIGQGAGRQQLAHALDRDDTRRSEGMLYAGMTRGNWYTQGRVGFGEVRRDVGRQLLLGNAVDDVWTRYDGRYRMAHGEGGVRVGVGSARLVPFVSLEYARSERDAFSEQGAGGFGLRSDPQAVERWQAGIGMRASRHWTLGNDRTFGFSAHAQWRRALAANGDATDASFVGLQQWSPLAGIGMSRRGYVFGVGADARLSRRTTLKVAYDREGGEFETATGLSALLDLAF